MNILNRILTLALCASLFIGCVKDIATSEETKLDFSKRVEVSLGAVSISTSESRAEAENPMAIGQRVRLYAMAKGSLEIIETRTYTITGTAGVPTLDADQKALTLPYGLFDIYLVGPVTHTDALGATHVIADVAQVNPMHGVDLVSSKTLVNILTSKSDIIANALKHKMTKLEINISLPSEGATYKDIDMTNGYIAIDNIGDSGQFTFDDSGGTVTSNAVGKKCMYNTFGTAGDIQKIHIVGVGKLFCVTDYALPTNGVNFKISTVFGYTVLNESKDKVEARLFTGQAERSFQGGTYLQLTAEPKPGIDMVCRTKILPWESGETTDLDVNNDSNLLFWYSGEDAPEMIEGKLCWRDRSGNGNHAIVVGNMVHDPVNKCYTPGTSYGSYFQPPELGVLTAYTFEVAAQLTRGSHIVAFDYRDGLAAFAYLSSKSTKKVAYYVGSVTQASPFSYGLNDLYANEKFSTYTFTQTGKTAELLINGVLYGKTMTNDAGEFNYIDAGGNYYPARIWESRGDKLPQQRLYGIRMYKKNMPSSGTPAVHKQLVSNYVNYVSKLAKTNVGVNANGAPEYIKDGLILDLRGADAPSGTPAVWPDRSRFKNSPEKGTATHNAAGQFYTGGLKFTKTLGTFKELTYEIVVRYNKDAGTGSNVLLHFTPRYGQDAAYMMRTGIYWCDFNTQTNGFVFEQPYITDKQRVTVPIADLKYPAPQNIAQLSCFRQNNKLYSSQNGYLYSDKVADISSTTTNELNNGTLGSAALDVFAVRIYNRPLSDFERQHNYLVDKRLYNILP